MNKLRVTDIIDMPITDARHVVDEINWWRQYVEVNRQEQQRRKAYMMTYQNKRREAAMALPNN